MIKRIFDIIFSFITLIICLPLFLIIAISIYVDSGLPVFYKQLRVGRYKKEFCLWKFRTMINNASKSGLLTIGTDDVRITSVGKILRNFKLDELPQLLNILLGEMSIVGPRPETPNFVALYNEEQLNVLNIRPGLTDYASLEYINENEILKKYSDPEKAYVNIVMPAKLKLNMQYLNQKSLLVDLKIIFKTLLKILGEK